MAYSEKQKNSWKKWYSNPENKKKHYERVRKNELEKKEWFQNLKKGKSCSKCKENHPSCLDYHHIDSSAKLFNVSTGMKLGYSKKRILEEISKCELICSNCHRKLHASEAEAVEAPAL